MPLEIAIQADGRASAGARLGSWRLRLLDHVEGEGSLRVVPGVEPGERRVVILATATERGFLEARIEERHLGRMARRAPERGKDLSSRLDTTSVVSSHRLHVAQCRQRAGLHRRFLGGHVHRHRRDVAHRELAADTVAVHVGVLAGSGLLPHQLVGDQAHGARRCTDREVAQGRNVTLPSQRPHDQVGIEAHDLGRVEVDRARRCGNRGNRPEAGTLRRKRTRDPRAWRRFGGRRRLVARCPQLLGHFLRQQLEDAVAEDRRHRSHVERRRRALLRADDGAVCQAGGGRKRRAMALAARLSARPSWPQRRKARDLRAVLAHEAADAIKAIEGRMEQVAAGVDQALDGVRTADDLGRLDVRFQRKGWQLRERDRRQRRLALRCRRHRRCRTRASRQQCRHQNATCGERWPGSHVISMRCNERRASIRLATPGGGMYNEPTA